MPIGDGVRMRGGAGRRIRPAPYLRAIAAVAVATAVGAAIASTIDVPNISLVFLIAVLFCAIADGLGASLFASLLGVLAYDFFFLPPLYSLDISDPADIVSTVAFLIAAVLASNLAARSRQQTKIAEHRAQLMAELHSYSSKLAGIAKLEDLGHAATRQIATMLNVNAALVLPEGTRPALQFAHPTAGAAPDPLRLPLRTERDTIGVLEIEREREPPALSVEEQRLLGALADQTAVAVERIRLADHIDEARLAAETERLRTVLLRSISHDLRTPLASILGAVTGLRAYDASYDRAARDELMATIQDEAERLNRFVGNLLDMTRLESGTLELRRRPADLDDIVGTALARCAKVLARHRVELDLAADLPPLDVDFSLFEQVLVNLLENAAKYTPAGSTIVIRSRQVGDTAEIEVIDCGPGIPPEDLERVFDQFYRVRAGDRQQAGTGLGLAICRGFIGALGGRIVARNRPDRAGAVLAISLPVRPVAARPHSLAEDAA